MEHKTKNKGKASLSLGVPGTFPNVKNIQNAYLSMFKNACLGCSSELCTFELLNTFGKFGCLR